MVLETDVIRVQTSVAENLFRTFPRFLHNQTNYFGYRRRYPKIFLELSHAHYTIEPIISGTDAATRTCENIALFLQIFEKNKNNFLSSRLLSVEDRRTRRTLLKQLVLRRLVWRTLLKKIVLPSLHHPLPSTKLEMSATDAFRGSFDRKIEELDQKKGLSSTFLSNDKYHYTMTRLKEIAACSMKDAKDHRMLKRFWYEIEVTRTPTKTIERLFKAGTNLVFVAKSELFNIIHELHLLKGHGARDVMFHEAKERYANVTREVLQLYVDACEECQLKRKKVRKSLVVKPIISKAMNSRAQVDLIDMQSQPDGDFKWIMNYQVITFSSTFDFEQKAHVRFY